MIIMACGFAGLIRGGERPSKRHLCERAYQERSRHVENTRTVSEFLPDALLGELVNNQRPAACLANTKLLFFS
jgi:hypothetical protein